LAQGSLGVLSVSWFPALTTSCTSVGSMTGLADPFLEPAQVRSHSMGPAEEALHHTVEILETRWKRTYSEDAAEAAVHRSIEVLEGCKLPHAGGKTSMLTSMCLLVQSIVGGGLLTFPYAYRNGGVVNMLALQVLLLPFIAIGLWILAWCTERSAASTYQAMVRQSLGRRAELFCELIILVLIFGASVVYLDVLVDQVHPWFQQVSDLCATEGLPASCFVAALNLNDRKILTLVMTALLSLLCLGRSMASLSIPSLMGFFALLYVCFMIIANFAADPVVPGRAAREAQGGDLTVAWYRPGLRQWFSLIPVICFSYQGHISAVPLYAELQYRSTVRWMKVIALGLAACVVLYNVTGVLGYLQFLEGTQSDVLKSFLQYPDALNIPAGFVLAGRLAVTMAVSVTSAVFTFCARSAVLDELNRLCGQNIESFTVFYSVTAAWMAAIAVTAICAPDVGAVVSVVGNFSAFFMFHFPGFCLIAAADERSGRDHADGDGKVQRSLSLRFISVGESLDRRSLCLRILGWTFVSVGTVVFVFGMASAMYGP